MSHHTSDSEDETEVPCVKKPKRSSKGDSDDEEKVEKVEKKQKRGRKRMVKSKAMVEESDEEPEEDEKVKAGVKRRKGKMEDDEEVRRQPRKKQRVEEHESDHEEDKENVVEEDEEVVPKPKPAKRGRKKKVVPRLPSRSPSPTRSTAADARSSSPTTIRAPSIRSELPEDDPTPPTKRKRGRRRRRSPSLHSTRSRSHSPIAPQSPHTLSALLANPSTSPLPLPYAEFQGMVIETLATSRASSVTVSVLWRTMMEARPVLREVKTRGKGKGVGDAGSEEMVKEKDTEEEEGVKEEMGKSEWMGLIELVLEEGKRKCGLFDRVESSFKDDHGKPLEAQWFYIPENDFDKERAALIRTMMPRAGKRTVTKKYKQYYYKPLGKISRWDPEDAI